MCTGSLADLMIITSTHRRTPENIERRHVEIGWILAVELLPAWTDKAEDVDL